MTFVKEGIVQEVFNKEILRLEKLFDNPQLKHNEFTSLFKHIRDADIENLKSIQQELIEKIKQIASPFSEEDATACVFLRDLIGGTQE